ncbi:MAG: phytase [Armatimonadetes bacterium]|nr:phytase [Armatimonadota bacterium]
MIQAVAILSLSANFTTEPVEFDADDPAIWVCRENQSRSLIFATDKIEEKGSIYAFDLAGKVVQRIQGLDRPNNCDVHGNLLVVTERMKNRLRFFAIEPTAGTLTDVTGTTASVSEPMGVAFYERHADRKLFVIVSPKKPERQNALAQYEIQRGLDGKVSTTVVRRFGSFSGLKEIESIAVDDKRGWVYYSDEQVATRVAMADPRSMGDNVVTGFNTRGFLGDHEGIAVTEDFVICTDQQPLNSVYHVFTSNNWNPVGSFSINADETDGIEATQTPLGPRYPEGIFVAMNSKDRNFKVLDMRALTGVLKKSSKAK